MRYRIEKVRNGLWLLETEQGHRSEHSTLWGAEKMLLQLKRMQPPKDERTLEDVADKIEELYASGKHDARTRKTLVWNTLAEMSHTHQSALAEEIVKEIEALAVEEKVAKDTWKKHSHLMFKSDAIAIIRRHLTPH